METIGTDEFDLQQDQCRLCDCVSDENGETYEMFSIFDKNDDGVEIVNLIQECLPLHVNKTDLLPKSVCADCLENLNNMYKFRKKSVQVAQRHGGKLMANGDMNEDKVLGSDNKIDDNISENGMSKSDEFGNIMDIIGEPNALEEVASPELDLPNTDLDIPDTELDDDAFVSQQLEEAVISSSKEDELLVQSNFENIPSTEKVDAETSTADLQIFCANCKLEIADAESVDRSKSASVAKSKRRRSLAFYHELEDSLSSSVTEFTNTESSQFNEYQTGVDTEDDDDERTRKRRKVEAPKEDETVVPTVSFYEIYQDEEEYRYHPLTLLQLCLNIINKENIPDYEPDEFLETPFKPDCSYCGEAFKNSKLLAMHEVVHMNIELGEKIDNPNLWHESRDDAFVRNKWLTSEDEPMEEEPEPEPTPMDLVEPEPEPEEEESLLIPVESVEQTDDNRMEEEEAMKEVALINGKPYVNGLPLSDYPKEERRSFYHSMRIGGVNKRFCALCRYSFKDNWAIESHYFSMACYYTCRYCGMRFNKQRNRFDEHVDLHIRNNDPYSTKVFAASKNVVPKIINARKRTWGGRGEQDLFIPQPIEVKNYIIERKGSLSDHRSPQPQSQPSPQPQPQIKVKQEPIEYKPTLSQQAQQKTSDGSKGGNQAYFCRKCYKVFFKLDEFNMHSKTCEFNQTPNNSNNSMLGNYLSSGSKNSNGETIHYSNSGRPLRNCAKDAGPYRDEAYVPDYILNDQVKGSSSSSQGPFVCYICNSPFPTIYSRNSHMRIHRMDNVRDVPASTSHHQNYGIYQETQQYHDTSVAHLAQVKEEPLDLEPEVEIHETTPQENFANSLGPAVSITPISKNPNQKPHINPNVMRLVKDNPQLTIRRREPPPQPLNDNNRQQQHMLQQMLVAQPDADKTYKCSSCWEAFSNKSHLYFHKKNQCEGSKYPCPFCKKRFGTEAAYSSHIFYSHPE